MSRAGRMWGWDADAEAMLRAFEPGLVPATKPKLQNSAPAAARDSGAIGGGGGVQYVLAASQRLTAPGAETQPIAAEVELPTPEQLGGNEGDGTYGSEAKCHAQLWMAVRQSCLLALAPVAEDALAAAADADALASAAVGAAVNSLGLGPEGVGVRVRALHALLRRWPKAAPVEKQLAILVAADELARAVAQALPENSENKEMDHARAPEAELNPNVATDAGLVVAAATAAERGFRSLRRMLVSRVEACSFSQHEAVFDSEDDESESASESDAGGGDEPLGGGHSLDTSDDLSEIGSEGMMMPAAAPSTTAPSGIETGTGTAASAWGTAGGLLWLDNEAGVFVETVAAAAATAGGLGRVGVRYVRGPPTRQEFEAQLRTIFSEVDTSGDGTVTFTEMASFWQARTPDKRNMFLEAKLFQHIDVDGDGAVTCDEFVSAFMSVVDKSTGVPSTQAVVSPGVGTAPAPRRRSLYEGDAHYALFVRLLLEVEEAVTPIEEAVPDAILPLWAHDDAVAASAGPGHDAGIAARVATAAATASAAAAAAWTCGAVRTVRDFNLEHSDLLAKRAPEPVLEPEPEAGLVSERQAALAATAQFGDVHRPTDTDDAAGHPASMGEEQPPSSAGAGSGARTGTDEGARQHLWEFLFKRLAVHEQFGDELPRTVERMRAGRMAAALEAAQRAEEEVEAEAVAEEEREREMTARREREAERKRAREAVEERRRTLQGRLRAARGGVGGANAGGSVSQAPVLSPTAGAAEHVAGAKPAAKSKSTPKRLPPPPLDEMRRRLPAIAAAVQGGGTGAKAAMMELADWGPVARKLLQAELLKSKNRGQGQNRDSLKAMTNCDIDLNALA
eukprot:g1669.t1